MKLFYSILALTSLFFLAAQGTPRDTCSPDLASCCCAAVEMEAESYGCCSQEAPTPPRPDEPSPCSCSVELPNENFPPHRAQLNAPLPKLLLPPAIKLPAAYVLPLLDQKTGFIADIGPPRAIPSLQHLHCSFLL